MKLMPHDLTSARPSAGRGLALAAAEARRAAAEAANHALFDVGDACEGSPIDALLAAESAGPHPMPAALAAAGVDAATLGNHDFDQGLPAVERLARQSPVPFTLCNLVRRLGVRPRDDEPLLPPFLLLDHHLMCGDGVLRKLRIGVIGVVPPQTLDWNADCLAGRVAARDAVEAVAGWLPEIRAARADLTVVLAHTGIGGVEAVPGMEHAAVPLAALDGVDVVLAGHSHRAFPAPEPAFPEPAFPKPAAEPGRVGGGAASCGPAIDRQAGRLHGKPAVMPGCWGRALGVVDLLLEAGPEGWRVVGSEAALRPVREGLPDPAVARVARVHEARVAAELRRPVARTARPLHTYFSLLADGPAVRLVAEAQREAVRAARPDIAADEGAVPLLSAAAPLKAGGLHGPDNFTDVPAGDLLRRHLIDLQIHPNRLHVVTLSGAELRLWLERAAAVFATVPEGARCVPLLDAEIPGYAFDVIVGLTYRIDISAPPLAAAWAGTSAGQQVGRIRDLRCRGRPVHPSDRFRVATHAYRLGSHPACAGLRARAEEVGGHTARQAVEDALRAGRAEGAPTARAWALGPIAGASVIYPTGPGARAYPPPERPGAGIVRRVGADPCGFDLYEIDLARAELLDGDAASPALGGASGGASGAGPGSAPGAGSGRRGADGARTARNGAGSSAT